MKIMIVDDNRDNLFLLEKMLKSKHYEVIKASSGKEALKKMDSAPIDMIISDILMPGMDGFQLCRKIKDNPNWESKPFIFYTATYTDPKDEDLAYKEGADRYLRKPMDPELFLKVIQDIIEETKDRKMVSKKQKPEEIEETLALYNSRLIKKLEKKMIDLKNEIEARSKVEDALRISELKYRQLFNASNDAMYVHYLPTRGKQFKFIEVNQIACERLGYTEKEFLELTPEDLIAPESMETARKAMIELKKKNQVIFEVFRITKDGRRIPVEINSRVFALNGHNTVLSISRDISFRYQAQKALEEREYRYRTLFNAGNDAVYVHQPDLKKQPGKFIEVNDVATQMLGYTNEEFLKLTPLDITDPDQIDAIENIKKIFDVKKMIFETVHVSRSGRKIPVEISAHLFFLNEKPTILSIVRDITERKRAEVKIRNSLQEKEILLRELYHRTKNNMQVISSMLRLYARKEANDQIKHLFEEIESKIISMALVHQKLYESDDLSHLNLKEYATSLVLQVKQSNLEYDNVKFQVNGDDINVLIDIAIPLGLVMNELITNSLKHAFPDDRQGNIEIILTKGKESSLILEISDDGVGFPKGFDLVKDISLGLQTVIDLIQYQLQGKITFTSDKGLHCRIELKGQQYKPRV